MPLEMPFEMRNLTSFRMEKLCYDLKLEVLKEIDAKDTIELAKVNTGFQGMLSRNPWLVFDHHVYVIDLDDWQISLQKFPGSSFVCLDSTHLPLSKRVLSCDKLFIDWRDERFSDEIVAILNQLHSVKRLVLQRKSYQCWPKFLENFRSVVKESVWLGPVIPVGSDIDGKNQVITKLFENFMENQANDCEEFDFECGSSTFHFYYEAFSKTSIKFLRMSAYRDEFEEIVQSIAKKQIPSKNLKAAFYVCALYSQEVNARLIDFLSQFCGMKRFDGDNLQEVTKMAIECLKNYPEKGSEVDSTNGLFFRRNIDSSRDCVYMLQKYEGIRFLAFYVQPPSEMMEF